MSPYQTQLQFGEEEASKKTAHAWFRVYGSVGSSRASEKVGGVTQAAQARMAS